MPFMGHSNFHVLLLDDSQMHRDMLIVGMSKEPQIKVKSMTGNAKALLQNIEQAKGFQVVVVYTANADADKRLLDTLTEKIVEMGMQIVLLSDFAKDNVVTEKTAILKRPAIGDVLGFGKLIAALVAFIKKEPVKVIDSSYMAERKRSWFSNELYNEFKKTADSKITDKVLREFIIAIGSSTGGTEALKAVLHNLPARIPPIVIVQHMPPVFTKMFADRLNEECKLAVKEAESGDYLQPGKVFIAPGDRQMRIIKADRGAKIECSGQEKIGGHCPAVNVLFESVADVYAANAVGIILTGMGKDGAAMLLKMRQCGARTIGQDEESSVVYGMPKAAYDIGAVERQFPVTQIAAELISTLAGMKER